MSVLLCINKFVCHPNISSFITDNAPRLTQALDIVECYWQETISKAAALLAIQQDLTPIIKQGNKPWTRSFPPMSQCSMRSAIPTKTRDYEESAGDLLCCLPLASRIENKVKSIASASQAKEETIPKLHLALITRMTTKHLSYP